MYVCICNALTDGQVTHVVANEGVTTMSGIYGACGCRAQCGQCAKALLGIMRGVMQDEGELQGAD